LTLSNLHRLHALNPSKSFIWILLALAITERIVLLLSYGFVYSDNDALVFWLAIRDYANGIFLEPYFYGQNYNPMLEAQVALPMYALGLRADYASVIATALIVLFVFMFPAGILYRHKHYTAALLWIALYVSLPTEYGMMTGHSRGFVSGLPFAALLVLLLVKPEQQFLGLWFGLLTGLALFFNANALPAFVFVGVYLLFSNFKKYRFYLHVILGLMPGLLLRQSAMYFYQLNPQYNVNSLYPYHYDFEWERLANGFMKTVQFFSYTLPLHLPGALLFPLLLVLLAVFVFRKRAQESVALLAATLFILLTLGIYKIHDHNGETILLASSRMFLALPVVFGFVVFTLFKSKTKPAPPAFLNGVFIIALGFFLFKMLLLNQTIAKHTKNLNYGNLALKPISEVKNTCEEIQKFMQLNQIDALVAAPGATFNYPELSFVCYACSTFINDFPENSMLVHDRRTKQYLKLRDGVYKRLLIIGDLQHGNGIINGTRLPYVILENREGLKTKVLLAKKLQIEMKRSYYLDLD